MKRMWVGNHSMRLTFCEGTLVGLRVKQLIWSVGISALSLSLAGVAMAADVTPAANPEAAPQTEHNVQTTTDATADVHVSVDNVATTSGSDSSQTTTSQVATSDTHNTSDGQVTKTDTLTQTQTDSNNLAETAATLSTTATADTAPVTEVTTDNATQSTAAVNAIAATLPVVLPARQAAKAHTEQAPAVAATTPTPEAPMPTRAPEPTNVPVGGGLSLNQLGSASSLLPHPELSAGKFPVATLALLLTMIAALLIAARLAVASVGASFVAWLRRAGFANAARGVTSFSNFATFLEVSLTASSNAAYDSFFDGSRTIGGMSPRLGYLWLVGGKQ